MKFEKYRNSIQEDRAWAYGKLLIIAFLIFFINNPVQAKEYNFGDRFFEVSEYGLLNSRNMTKEEALDYRHDMAQKALVKFIKKAAELGIAREISKPAPGLDGVTAIKTPEGKVKYYDTSDIFQIVMGEYIDPEKEISKPAPGLDGVTAIITPEGKVKYYDTSDITQAVMGEYIDPKTDSIIHLKPDYEDLSLAFEGLPLPEEMDQRRHYEGITASHRNSAWIKQFGGLTDEQLYRLGQRLAREMRSYRSVAYEDVKDDPIVQEKIKSLRPQASAFSYYRLGSRSSHTRDFRTHYDEEREDEYLPMLLELWEKR